MSQPLNVVTPSDADLQYMGAALKAAQRSPDPMTQNGACLVSQEGVYVTACNTMPNGIKQTPERWERPHKYNYIQHAEDGSIYLAAKVGLSTERATLYVPWYACSRCAAGIIAAGIRRVVGHRLMLDGAHNQWRQSVEQGLSMLQEAGVITDILDYGFATTLRRNGEEVIF